MEQSLWTGGLSILVSSGMEERSCKMNLRSHGTTGMEEGCQE